MRIERIARRTYIEKKLFPPVLHADGLRPVGLAPNGLKPREQIVWVVGLQVDFSLGAPAPGAAVLPDDGKGHRRGPGPGDGVTVDRDRP